MYFVENLTLRSWFVSVLPRLLWKRIRRRYAVDRCYVIDGSRFTILVAKASARITGIIVEKLAFRLTDIRDEAGLLIRLRIAYQDLSEVQREVMQNPVFRDLFKNGVPGDRLTTYLTRCIATMSFSERTTLWRALLLVHICVRKVRDDGVVGSHTMFFLERRPWSRVIERYASRFGVEAIPVRVSLRFDLRGLVYCFMGPKGIEMLRSLRDGAYRWFFLIRQQRIHTSTVSPPNGSTTLLDRSESIPRSSTPRVAVEYYGHLNLNQPELYSDLFFWQQSLLSGKDIVVTFWIPQDPVDEKKWRELTDNGMTAVALDPRAATTGAVPLFRHHHSPDGKRDGRSIVSSSTRSLETRWLGEQVFKYRGLRDYWTDLFSRTNVKIYLTWYKYDATHCAIADALQELGGVLAIYQRAYEDLPTVATTIDADIVFGFSPNVADVERLSNSIIPYHVTTGYLGDHRFALVRGKAQEVRDALRQRGTTHILSFFDENSADDSRWHTGHEFQRENYAFLLEKVLAKPWLGLVLKPKTPSSLRRRLGAVAELLARAQATGRCYIYEDGALQGSYPPAAAAMAADIAIHGHLCAATAGLEAALAGVPTLLMDREGWHVSPLYRLGVGRVVFKDWQELWEACVQHWTTPAGIPGLGDWSSMLDELDPFRDGRAAERMGTYIQWLIEGFKAGLDREIIMADAAERYCAMWGRDKVTEVNSRSWPCSNGRDYTGGGLQASTSRPTPMDRITSQFQQRS